MPPYCSVICEVQAKRVPPAAAKSKLFRWLFLCLSLGSIFVCDLKDITMIAIVVYDLATDSFWICSGFDV
jgi:hypothetical protein